MWALFATSWRSGLSREISVIEFADKSALTEINKHEPHLLYNYV